MKRNLIASAIWPFLAVLVATVSVGRSEDQAPPSGARPTVDVVLGWNTFAGSTSTDQPPAVAADTSGNIYMASGGSSWGSPIRPWSGGRDAFVAKLSEDPIWRPRHAVGDFDKDGYDGLMADFGASGLWLYDQGVCPRSAASTRISLRAARF